jgi:hypothetical protein
MGISGSQWIFNDYGGREAPFLLIDALSGRHRENRARLLPVRGMVLRQADGSLRTSTELE